MKLFLTIFLFSLNLTFNNFFNLLKEIKKLDFIISIKNKDLPLFILSQEKLIKKNKNLNLLLKSFKSINSLYYIYNNLKIFNLKKDIKNDEILINFLQEFPLKNKIFKEGISLFLNLYIKNKNNLIIKPIKKIINNNTYIKNKISKILFYLKIISLSSNIFKIKGYK